MDSKPEFVLYKIFEPFENILAFTTSKQTLKGVNPRFTGDVVSIYEDNRKELADKLGIEKSQLVFPRQTHTNCVAEIIDLPKTEITETDALVSNKKGVCLCVQTADCVPILLFDPEQNVIAAVHAGWRGTVSKIADSTIQKMISKYHSSPQNILAAIGPSIGPEVYEVGDEVVNAVRNSIPNPALTLSKNSSGKYHFNLWEANKQLLMAAKVLPENIEVLGECSFQKSNKYFSARKEGIETGRMVSGIMLK